MTVLAEDGPLRGDAVMNAIAAPKSSAQNRLEGFALIAIFQGLPTFAAAVLLLKLFGSHEIVGVKGGAALFVVLATLAYALFTPLLARRFPKMFKNACEPLFYDPNLSFAEKLAGWRVQPMVSRQLLAMVMMLSLLAVAVVSVR
jgi:hypothetical protein